MLMLCTPQAKGDLICLWVRADVLWSRRRPPRKQPLRQSFGHELLRALCSYPKADIPMDSSYHEDRGLSILLSIRQDLMGDRTSHILLARPDPSKSHVRESFTQPEDDKA